ncbi:hypothetical protein GCM10027449_18430 [Sinomonas notoginsengisoli]|uniref:recombinase family protein n=1 Tax=Sinomonas notoginsengisoli TaxID=1457311 RepID=UPI001F27E58C|nr:recombinase family protein [Sinomonas notoginsengisoli]
MSGTAVYVRQSRDATGDAVAVTRQKEDTLALAKLKGWAKPRVFQDNDLSASTGRARPGFEALLAEIATGRVTRLVVWHLDRLSRTTRDLARVIDAGQPHALEVVSVHGTSLNMADPSGVAVAEILTSIAAMEVKHKGQRQRRANEQRAAAGSSYWSVRPFGYDLRDGAVVVVEDEAASIRSGAQAILEGASLAAVTRDWNERHTTTRGGSWSIRSVTRVLANRRYIGRRLHRGRDVAAGQWEPILSEDTFEQLQNRLKDPNRLPPPDRAVRHLLAGILTCGVCGKPCHGRGDGNPIYRCPSGHVQRQRAPIDDLVRALVLARLRPVAAKVLPRNDDLASLRARAAGLRDRRDALAALLADGVLGVAAVRAQSAKLTAELTGVEDEIRRAEGADALSAIIAADDLGQAWDAAPLTAKRDILRRLVARVELHPAGNGVRFRPEQVRFEWKQP